MTRAYYLKSTKEAGGAFLVSNDYEQAKRSIDKAIALNPSDARAFNNRALAHVALGQPDQALADYATAIKLDPGYLRAYENRLRLLEQRGDKAFSFRTF